MILAVVWSQTINTPTRLSTVSVEIAISASLESSSPRLQRSRATFGPFFGFYLTAKISGIATAMAALIDTARWRQLLQRSAGPRQVKTKKGVDYLIAPRQPRHASAPPFWLRSL